MILKKSKKRLFANLLLLKHIEISIIIVSQSNHLILTSDAYKIYVKGGNP
jgi:hypothetical protein